MTGIGSNDQQVNYRPFVDSRELLERPDRLREHMGDSGYLFVSGLVPPEALREVYDDISAVVRAVSWADEENRAHRIAAHGGGRGVLGRLTIRFSAWSRFTLLRTGRRSLG